MQKWAILDGWGVVYQEPGFVQRLLTPYLRQRGCPLDAARIYQAYRETSLGVCHPREFWRAVGCAGEYPAIEAEFAQTCPRLAAGAIEAIVSLRTRYRVGLLSNDVAQWAARLRARFGLEPLLDQVLISADARLRKPALGIYRLFLERAQASADQCVFVDDRAENLEAAATLGIHTIHLLAGAGPAFSGAGAAVSSMQELPAAVARVLPADSWRQA
jgi:putative hydrolase of the HAD superfamily